jgi:hypothetical protein
VLFFGRNAKCLSIIGIFKDSPLGTNKRVVLKDSSSRTPNFDGDFNPMCPFLVSNFFDGEGLGCKTT